jgi:acetolactate synthase I/II/III large subunit
MDPRTGADLLVDHLFAHGVRTIFGMPGSHTTAIYDALERYGRIETVLVRNEQAGAFMADGYARVTGRPGVICTTAGPGATNALTGIAEAWADSMPMLLLAGQVNHDRLHEECGNYHEIDLEGIFRPCTRFVTTVMDHAQVPAAVSRAFAAMTQGRRRPAALVLPQDLMGAPLTGEPSPVRGRVSDPPGPDPATIDHAAQMLTQARRPLLLAGGGAVWAEVGAALRHLAEQLDCPLATTLNGKGILDERDPRALGHLRSPRGKVALPVADLVLAVGCRFTEVMTGFRALRMPERLIQIDIDPGQIGVNYPATIGLEGDAAAIVPQLLDRLPRPQASDWQSFWPAIRAARPEKPEWLIDALRSSLPDDAIVFTDASELAYRMHTEFPAYAPRTFFYPSNYIALGWGFPAALGAAVALPGRVVVSMSGDGGFVMTCQELATAARYGLRVIAVIHNDSTYGAIKNLQRIKHAARYRDTDLNNPDFVSLAESFGVRAYRTERADQFAAALRDAVALAQPALIEVRDTWRYLRV